MSIPEQVRNAAWHGNWRDDEETIHRILAKPPVDAQPSDRSRSKQQFAFGRSKGTRGYVPPEAVRSAVEGDSLICSIRQTKSRPLSGRPMGHSEKTRLAVIRLHVQSA